ncbi:TetR family transcriptional regulator [Salmonella enterica subsp. enterica serovar Choleraesuis]|nr:TetR family transcriptional regulator [Salmonella enterica subsp. enterica serovar Choleraesuis]
MPATNKPLISSRKQPKQARSAELVSAIIQAAIQVLEKEGATRFTTARVAEKAGVSVGSLYQYFPNKAAILFRLQHDEWQQTHSVLAEILGNKSAPPVERLRTLIRVFIRSECEEARLRQALNDAAPLYRDAPQAKQSSAAAREIYDQFIAEILPRAAESQRRVACELLTTTLSSVGSSYSAHSRNDDEILIFSEAMADMLSAWLNVQQTRQDNEEPR